MLALDDFYRDGDQPGLPRRFGIVDWDHPASWDAEAALTALDQLCRTGSGEVPEYDLTASRRTGSRGLDLAGAPVLVAEGIFAAELVAPCAARGVLADALCLQLHPVTTFARRLARDLAESRKPVPTLVRRGVALARSERALLARWQQLGCRPVGVRQAEAAIRTLLPGPGARPPG